MKTLGNITMWVIFVTVLGTSTGFAWGGYHPAATSKAGGMTPAPAASIGTATMLKDGTIVYYERHMTNDAGERVFVSKVSPGSPGYQDAIRHIGGIKPGESKPIPPYTPNNGYVEMLQDKSLLVQLRSVGKDGAIFEGQLHIKPGDAQYKKILKRLGGLKPGETKLLPASN